MALRRLNLAASIVVGLSAVAYALPQASNVRFLGRVNPQTLELSWPATGVAFEFTGTQATVSFASQSGSNSVAWIIDNGSPIAIPAVTGTSVSTPSLPSGHHSVQLLKRSESILGSLYFANVSVSSGSPKPATTPARRIEFIGDSITVGYGEAGTLPCTNDASVEDAPNTYGVLTARNLSAAFSLVAVSGRGITRNYVTSGIDTSPVMPELWTRYGANDADNSYTFPSAVTPQAVVINLGTNDYSYLLYAADGTPYNGRSPLDNKTFEQAYLAFVKQVIGKYPKAQVFLCSSPMLNDNWPTSAEKQHTSQLQAIKWASGQIGSSKIHVVDFPSQVAGVGITGCDSHPGPVGHKAMAEALIPVIKSTLGW